MTRRLAALALAAGAACTPGGRGRVSGPAADLAKVARSADASTYKVSYSFAMAGRASAAASTVFSIVQRPPDSVHLLETSIVQQGSRPIVARSWTIRRGDVTYACSDFGGVSCTTTPSAGGEFGHAQVDEGFSLARRPGAFASVDEVAGAKIAGETARCFKAVGRRATPAPVSSPQPRYDPEQFDYALCFARDGVLVKMSRTALGPVPSGIPRAASTLEAMSITRTVAARDLDLPGPVRTPPGRPG